MSKSLKSYAVIALLLLTVFLLLKKSGQSDIAWKYIPESAIAVITSDALQSPTLYNADSSFSVKELPLIDEAVRNLSVLDWFTPSRKEIDNFLAEKNIAYSFHLHAGKEVSVVMFIPVHSEQEEAWIANPKRTDVRITHHTFQNQRITDVNDLRSRPLYSYIIKDDLLIISKQGYLVEEALSLRGKSDLKEQFASLDHTDFPVNLYLRGETLPTFLSIASSNSTLKQWLKYYPALQDYHLDLSSEADSNQLVLASSEGGPLENTYLTNWVQKQQGSTFEGYNYISQQTAFLYRISSDNEDKFRSAYLKWQQKNRHEGWNQVKRHLGKSADTLLQSISPEIFLTQGATNTFNNRLVFVRIDEYHKLRNALRQLSHLSAKDGDVAFDQYMGYDLYSVHINEFPSTFLGELFTGFPRSYVTYVAPYLVISNSPQVLRTYLTDYENQLTWSQSPEYDQLLTTNESIAPLQAVVNLPKVVPNVASTNNGLVQQTEIITADLYVKSGEGFPKIRLIPKRKPAVRSVLNKTFLNTDIYWPVVYDRKIKALQNPVDGSSEVLLTDEQHQLFKISNEQKVAPSIMTTIDGSLATTSYKADFLNIGRQQRVLATTKSVYIIDEDEQGISTTIQVPSPSPHPITHLFMIDGSSESSNGFILKDGAEHLYLLDSPNKKPRKITNKTSFDQLLAPIETIHLPGKRYFILTEPKGKIYLLDERGNTVTGFPVDLLSRLESSFTWATTGSSDLATLVGITPMGELTHIDLTGNVLSRRQLFRSEANNRFRIIYDANLLDWMIVRTSPTRMAILDKEGNEQFEIVNIRPGASIDYHFFGVDNRFITVLSGGYTSIFDLTGKPLGNQPIPSDQPVSITYQSLYNKLLIYSQNLDKIQTWSIKLR